MKSLRFDALKEISPSAALVLASEVDRWNQKVKRRLRAATESWDPEIMRKLCQMGYFELLDLPKPDLPTGDAPVTFLKFWRGTPDLDQGKVAQELRIQIEAIVGEQIRTKNRTALFAGLSEAITNVGQHAYPDTTEKSKKQWWVSASFDRDTRKLTVMFFDQGFGIPRTLTKTKWKEFLQAFVLSWTDSQRIAAAMEYGRTRTKRANRGKGLWNLQQFAKSHLSGKLSIYSLKGLYTMSHSETGTVLQSTRDFKYSIDGTLIEWSVQL